MNASLTDPQPVFITAAGNYTHKKFNSPNDLAVKSNGDIYFTDPPYGLEKGPDDPARELPCQGVYRITKNGTVSLLIDSLTGLMASLFFRVKKAF